MLQQGVKDLVADKQKFFFHIPSINPSWSHPMISLAKAFHFIAN